MKKQLKLTINLKLPQQDLIQTLVDLHYFRVPMVSEPGDFAVRGSLIDIFPSNHSHPLRIDYDDDTLIDLFSFESMKQKKISSFDSTIISTYQKKKQKPQNEITTETTFEEGDYVVHEDYGIGVYKGPKRITIREEENEYIIIQYRGKDVLYVPFDQQALLHPYSYADVKPKLSSLHDSVWKKTKKKAEQVTESIAEELFELYQKRLENPGFAFKEDSELQLLMENTFPYTLTKDQAKAIESIKADMEAPIAMDRLLCGDVGYGKTEVLLRAAFKAMESYKQVAIVVPTTLLASQHYHVFQKRLKEFPFNIQLLSRFIPKEQQKAIIKLLKNQQCDLIIGTHRLLQKDIQFKDLGLLIIDEEQRFGVKQKEALKKLKTQVDVISISATPIPRTLYMALTGSKDMSIIHTPPQNRKPIKTIVLPYDPDIVKNMIHYEIERKGQVFYIYNSVQTIHKKTKELRALCPELEIQYAHGQQSETEIKRVMEAFIKGDIDVLVSSTIIENGIDIPNANTIIIDRAEHLGLSQIHQLRGRVGRSSIQAFAGIFYNPFLENEKSKNRLDAIQDYASLGSGYNIALRDLELRGSGDILSDKQHGTITQVGLSLYCHMLEESLKRKKAMQLMLHPDAALHPETH